MAAIFWSAWLMLLCGVRAADGDHGVNGEPPLSDSLALTPVVFDPGSGCSCKVQPSTGFTVCFDRMACKRFPRNYSVPSTGLYIKTSVIPELVVGDLDLLHHLTQLNIENSLLLHRIEPGFFDGMKNLVSLTISFNQKLSHLEPDAFRGLDNLKALTLEKNAFHSLGDIAPSLSKDTLPRLDVFMFKENQLRHVGAHEFRAMEGSPLRELDLISCQIEHIHPGALLPLRNLRVLQLGGNSLNTTSLAAMIDSLVQEGISLYSLDLQSIGLRTSLPADMIHAVAKSNITELGLKRNEVKHLSPMSFSFMPNLRKLDLSEVELSSIERGTFAEELMPRLETLNLSYNKLREVLPGILNPSLRTLDLTGNSVSGNAGQDYFEMGLKTFANMTNLRELHISYNRINRLTVDSFVGLSNLRVLSMKNSSLFRLDEGAFGPLRSLESLNLEKNLFAVVRNVTPDIFLGLGNLRVLRLTGCSITSLGRDQNVFKHLTSLTHLHLDSNYLVTLDSALIFQPLRSLIWLDVSHNEIGSWRRRIFTKNSVLRELRAVGNRITYLSPAMIHDLDSLEVVDLSRNPFNCACDYFRPISEWLALPNVTEPQRRNITKLYRYRCLSPDEWRDRRISDYMMFMNDRSDCTPSDVSVALLIAVPIGVLVLISIGVALVLYRYRHHLRYWGFLTRTAMGQSQGLTKNGGELTAYNNFQYDAFVSYSSEDQAFVQRLVTMLEDHEPYFKLCVYERDFSIGMAITEAVLGSVALSRRILLVVSQSFARSQWCAWEAHMAHHQRLLLDDNSLLVVKLGPVDEDVLTPTLRYLLRTRIYLEYDAAPEKQKTFWRKLRNSLLPPIGSTARAGARVGTNE